MKETTRLRLQIKEVETIEDKANNPGDKICAAILKKSLCKKFIEKMYPKPKEL